MVIQSHITVCVCTFKRPALLRRLLHELAKQRIDQPFSYSVVVVDNDAALSAEQVVREVHNHGPIEMEYCCEPIRNIARVRNKAIERAKGEFIAFIDDDEFPVGDWLARLLQCSLQYKAAGVLGPVRPHFDNAPPVWIVQGRFCERPEHPTGTVMHWRECRTGNVLLNRGILASGQPPFDERFQTGGEDVDFFMRMSDLGHIFVWCNEAVAYETVPPSRMKRSYMLHRALLRGNNSLKIRRGRALASLKSMLAIPIYSAILPFALVAGQHQFMYYCIRLCDHLGRLMALLGVGGIEERKM
jgi:succinoglycan biosynthesis protein ExoM